MSLDENKQVDTPIVVTTVAELVKSIPHEVAISEPIKKTQLIYCGPNLQRGILTQYTVFRGDGLPKHLDQHIANCPAISRLLVPPKLLSKTIQAINTTGTPQNIWFKEIQAYVQGGVK